MKQLSWEHLLTLASRYEKAKVEFDSTHNYGVHFTSGRYEGSTLKLTGFTTVLVGYQAKRPRLDTIKFLVEGQKDRLVSWNWSKPKWKGSAAVLVEGFTGPDELIVTQLTPEDCFGAAYEPGKIVSYKRDAKQIFSVVESINDIGRIKLRRIYNKSRSQKFDYINYENSKENLIIDDGLLNKLMLLRLKTE